MDHRVVIFLDEQLQTWAWLCSCDAAATGFYDRDAVETSADEHGTVYEVRPVA